MNNLRRRIMMQQGGKIPYIRNGLILYCDGINKGTNSLNTWVDLIGGVIFTSSSNIASSENAFIFDGSQYMIADKIVPQMAPTESTIEIVFRSTKSSGWFVLYASNYSKEQNQNALGVMWYNNYIYTGEKTNYGYMANIGNIRNTNVIISASGENIIFNKIKQNTTISNSVYSGNGCKPTIGDRLWNGISTGRFVGEIYAVRIYNRLLSVEEMQYNQQIDNKRFNLGL